MNTQTKFKGLFPFAAKLCFVLISLYFFMSVYQQALAQPNYLIQLNNQLTRQLIDDQFSPPVASRIYVYSNLAAARVLVGDEYLKKFSGFGWQPSTFQNVAEPERNLAAALVFVQVAGKLVFATADWKKATQPIVDKLSDKLSPESIKLAELFATETSNIIMPRADTDGYKHRLTFVKYSVSKSDSAWQPTPPGFGDPVEPFWSTIKPLIEDKQIGLEGYGPNPYSTNPESAFQLQLKEVYDMAKKNTAATLDIARHWDCNPIQLGITGHIMQFGYRMTPAGHWTALACDILETRKANATETALVLSRMNAACFDAFIDCWTLKYKFNSIRPVTVINRQMDADWKSAIETPAFPEYPSGHSEVSAAAAIILGNHFGEKFTYTDSSQAMFNLPTATFSSFKEAAIQAGESRILGGIHYRKAVNDGYKRGVLIGEAVKERTKK